VKMNDVLRIMSACGPGISRHVRRAYLEVAAWLGESRKQMRAIGSACHG